MENPCKELWYEERIKELEAENENLKANLTHLRQTCQRAWDKCDEERVKLAKAVVALDKIKRIDNLVGVFAACERTLAELNNPEDSMKGEKDE